LVPEPNEFVLTLSSRTITNARRQHPGKNSRIPRKHYLRHAETPCNLGLKIHNSYSMPIQYLLCETAAYDTLETHLKKENESYINNCLVLDQTQLYLKPRTRSGQVPVQSTQHYKNRSLFGPALSFYFSHISIATTTMPRNSLGLRAIYRAPSLVHLETLSHLKEWFAITV